MNNVKSSKYEYAPEQVEEKPLDKETGEDFKEGYDFHRLIKIKENKDRIQKHELKRENRKKCLRSPLEIWEKVFVLAESLKKKDARGKFYRSTTENKNFFNRDRIFKITNRSRLDNQNYIDYIFIG